MNYFPHYPNRKWQNLDGVWSFGFLGTDAPGLEQINPVNVDCPELMSVPGCFDSAIKYAGVRGVGLYRREVKAAANAALQLNIGAVGLRGRIFWDGKEIAVNELPYSFQKYFFNAGAGENHTLEILIDNRFNFQDSPLFSPFYDFYGYGGIYRSVDLFELPAGPVLDRVEIITADLNAGEVTLTGRLRNAADGKHSISVAFDQNSAETVAVDVCNNVFTLKRKVPHFKVWSCDCPALHLLTCQFGNDTIVERFGIRTVETKKGQILLNGKAVQLKGYNRHDCHPQFGPAMNPVLWLEDLQILKDLNCNFIRGSHYPQSQQFLDLCDQLGFLVWEESLGWGDREEIQKDEKFIRLQIEQTVNMVKTSINHSSIIMWGFMNEGGDKHEAGEKLFRTLAQAVRDNDRSRPLTFASMYPDFGRCFDCADIISINNYPGWYEGDNWTESRPLHRIEIRLNEILHRFSTPEFIDKPFIISEIGAGAMYGCHDRLKAQWSEEYQRDLIDEVCNYIEKHPRVNGLALWQFTDGRTYSAGGVLGRPRAFNNKGTLDEYRRPKLAYDLVKSRFDEKKSR